ncbi:MAG: hypothetical protein KF756_10110 [Acidobacteria bacterium]|nr:hypothetical protein [Acidobacteriota bacterium]
MKLRNILAAAVSAMSLAVIAAAQTAAPTSSTQELVDLLPASNAVITVDVQKGLREALPKLLAGNPQIKAEFERSVSELNSKAGADFLKFSKVVVGVSFQNFEGGAPKPQVVGIARGDLNVDQILATVRATKKTPCDERVVSGKTIYVCQIEIPAKKDPKASGTTAAPAPVIRETAFVALDANTLAVGDPSRVIETIEHASGVNPTLRGLLKDSPTTVAAFAMESVAGLEKFVPLDNDDLGNALKNLKYMAGSANTAADGFVFSGLFRSTDAASSKQLSSLLLGLQSIGKAFLGSSKRADQKMYGRLIDSVKITQADTDVSLSIALPQADINALMAQLKLDLATAAKE